MRNSFSFFLRRHLELKFLTLRVVNCAQKLTFPLLADPTHHWVLTAFLPHPGEGVRLGCPRAGFRVPQPFHRVICSHHTRKTINNQRNAIKYFSNSAGEFYRSFYPNIWTFSRTFASGPSLIFLSLQEGVIWPLWEEQEGWTEKSISSSLKSRVHFKRTSPDLLTGSRVLDVSIGKVDFLSKSNACDINLLQ